MAYEHREKVYVSVPATLIKAESAKAFLCVIDGTEHWLPKSQFEEPDQYHKGDTDVELILTDWICKQKEINYE